MDGFVQAAALVLLAVIVSIFLAKQNGDIVLAVSIGVSILVLGIAVRYFEPVIDYLKQLQSIAKVDDALMEVLLKAVGIGMITEIVCLICVDAGRSALAKSLQFLSAGVMLWMSIPLLKSLLELLSQIMEGI